MPVDLAFELLEVSRSQIARCDSVNAQFAVDAFAVNIGRVRQMLDVGPVEEHLLSEAFTVAEKLKNEIVTSFISPDKTAIKRLLNTFDGLLDETIVVLRQAKERASVHSK